ncbi:MAG: TIGR03067 domain-containing protein [Phycisphaerales bacterium]|nr:TIGR03067 domain-containing protein [Phycisphaerales bacterium]MCB9835502.1 TIGR03067 domain-containing protein [Phycisphaera sp.]
METPRPSSHSLPPRPNLDHLRRQAKALLAALADGDQDAAKTFIEHLPAAKRLTPSKVKLQGFRLADAQSAIARRTGFASWPALARHVETLRAMEGSWSFASLEVEGSHVPAGSLASSRILIDGDRFRTESPDAIYEGVFNIDVEADPNHIDIEFVEGPEAGNSNFGIFRLDKDRLEICLDMRGKPRPAAFQTKPASGHAYEVLTRGSASRPENVTGGDRSKAASDPNVVDAVDPSAFAYVPSDTLARLEGEWSAVEIVREGHTLPAFMLKTAGRSAVKNEIKISVGGMLIIHALVRVDESQSPVHVDYGNIGGVAKGTVQHGIMEWRGDTAWFCMASPGQPRPTTFENPSTSVTLSAWKKR